MKQHLLFGLSLLALTFASCSKKSDDASPSNPNNPQTAACRLLSTSDSTSASPNGVKTSDIEYDANKRPIRVNNYSTNGTTPTLSSYYKLDYSGSTVTLTRYRSDNTVDTSFGTRTAIVQNGLVTQTDEPGYDSDYIDGVRTRTRTVTHSIYSYNGSGLLTAATQTKTSTPVAGGTTKTTTSRVTTTISNGLITKISSTTTSSPADTNSNYTSTEDITYSSATLAPGNSVFGSLLPGYPIYFGNKMPASTSSTYTVGQSSQQQNEVYTATINAKGYVTQYRKVETYTYNGSTSRYTTKQFFEYDCN